MLSATGMLGTARPLAVMQPSSAARNRAPAPARPLQRGMQRKSRSPLTVTASTNPLRPGESAEQALARRMKESARVEERVKRVETSDELAAALALAPEESLVILTIMSESECNLGPNPAAAWANKTETNVACRKLQDTMLRVSRESTNVTFLELEGDANAQTRELMEELGAKTLPTVQYWKGGRLLWQTMGAAGSEEVLGEGVLFYAGEGAAGALVSDYVEEVASKPTLEAFLASCSGPQVAVRGITLSAPCTQQLAVLDVSLGRDSPGCVHVFPAVLALAKTTAGAVRWARLLGDASPAAEALMKELKVETVPTFVLFADNKEVGRYSGTDRGTLMATVLEAQAKVGYKMPEPPVRKRPSIAEAKKIAAEARERERAAGRQSGW